MLDESFLLPTKQETVTAVEQKIEQICEHLNVADRCIGNILISVTEAINNAIVHGNKNDVSKQVSLNCISLKNELIFTVKDEGLGFDFSNLPDPTDPENREKLNGRGVFLMKHLADKVSFEESGRIVKLTFINYAND